MSICALKIYRLERARATAADHWFVKDQMVVGRCMALLVLVITLAFLVRQFLPVYHLPLSGCAVTWMIMDHVQLLVAAYRNTHFLLQVFVAC